MRLFTSRPPPAWEIYAEELGGLGLGYPMWYPELGTPGGEVKLGDIGYLRDGEFHLLFNCTLPEDDPSHMQRGERLPRDFVPFEFDPGDRRGPLRRVTQSEVTCTSFRQHMIHAEGGAGYVASCELPLQYPYVI